MSHTTDVACDNQHSNAFRNDGVTRVNNVVARVNYGDDAIQVIAKFLALVIVLGSPCMFRYCIILP